MVATFPYLPCDSIEMTSDRKTARIVGILFTFATVASILSLPFLEPINASTYLVKFSADQNQVLVGALFVLIGAAASVSIAISLYPILRKYNEGLALGAVSFRLIEGMLDVIGVIAVILLLALSQQFVKTGAPDSSYFQTLGVVLLAGYDWVLYVGSVLAFALGALMYYYIFYQTQLVPRWLSSWGLVGAALSIVSSMLVMFHLIGPFSAIQVVLNLPFIGAQEMVLAAWLIVRGFNPSSIVSELPEGTIPTSSRWRPT
jgi:hypothetical protein